ncbi:MAG: MBL fold metallo-hydrolase [Steroidobacteraceae bacterium]|nr:MBL fold metallo-hydrolase [Deltaproteobacteria bacterium]
MLQKKRRLPFRYLEPAFFAGLLDDPLLFLRIRPLRRALLFDCGQITHLAKRVVKAIDTVFITHAHMDHIMGIPTLVRHHHASPRPLDIFGPPGIAERIYHLLMGYDWNLSEPNWFTLRVHEVTQEQIFHFSFAGPEGFASHFDGQEPRRGREIWSCRYAAVEAELLDHKLTVLAFRIQEKPHFAVDPRLLEQHGLLPGDWIRELKKRVWKRSAETRVVPRRAAEIPHGETLDDPDRLYAAIRADLPCSSIGYLCDVGWTAENIARIEKLLSKVTLLCADCSFLAADVEKARNSYHLCTSDLNDLTLRLAPRYLLPMHLSKSYLYRTADLYQELQPPRETTVLALPKHLVPAPLMVQDVEGWLRSTDVE